MKRRVRSLFKRRFRSHPSRSSISRTRRPGRPLTLELLEGRRLLAGDLFASTSALTDPPLSAAITSGPVVTTDKVDYQPGETANITGTGFEVGETVQFQVLHIDTMISTDELVAQFDFNSGAVVDTSTSTVDHSGTLIDNATLVDGRLTFDGVGDYLRVDDSSEINLGTHSSRTISFFFKADDASSATEKQVLYKEGDSSRGLNIYLFDGRLYVGGWNQPDDESNWEGTFLSAALTDSEWHSVTLVLDGGATVESDAFRGYLDGQQFGTGSGSQLWNHSGNVAVGAVDGSTRFHDGPVGLLSDSDGDSDSDGFDFLAWQRGFGSSIVASQSTGDANTSGNVDSNDLALWSSEFGSTSENTVGQHAFAGQIDDIRIFNRALTLEEVADIPDNTGSGHLPWLVTDGGAGDLDGVADGKVETTWFVDPDDSAFATFELIATGLSSAGVATTTFTDAPTDINVGKHEGQMKSGGVLGGYTSGNVTEYAEGDSINFLFELDTTSLVDKSGTLEVRFSIEDATCTFFDGSFTLGTHDGSAPPVVQTGTDVWTVTTVGAPVQDIGNQEWVQTIQVDYDASNVVNASDMEAVVNYFLTLEDDIGSCSGSSQHSRIGGATGDVSSSGTKNIPVPGGQVLVFPEITVIKNIDRDGDGTFESTAVLDEYQFTLDATTMQNTDASGQTVFTMVSDGSHTITELQLDFSQGMYEFVSGSGTNVTFMGDTATATVMMGTSSTVQNAEVIFNNRLVFNPDYTITKTLLDINDDTNDTVINDAGDVLTYTVVLENTGNQTLTNVVLGDDLVADAVGTPVETGGAGVNGDGNLDVGETWTYTYDYTVLQSDIDSNATNEPDNVIAGKLDNTATSTTTEIPEEKDDDEQVDLAQDPDYTITKTLLDINDDTNDTVINDAGDVLTYTVVLENTGNQTLTNVVLGDDLVADACRHAGRDGRHRNQRRRQPRRRRDLDLHLRLHRAAIGHRLECHQRARQRHCRQAR